MDIQKKRLGDKTRVCQQTTTFEYQSCVGVYPFTFEYLRISIWVYVTKVLYYKRILMSCKDKNRETKVALSVNITFEIKVLKYFMQGHLKTISKLDEPNHPRDNV